MNLIVSLGKDNIYSFPLDSRIESNKKRIWCCSIENNSIFSTISPEKELNKYSNSLNKTLKRRYLQNQINELINNLQYILYIYKHGVKFINIRMSWDNICKELKFIFKIID